MGFLGVYKALYDYAPQSEGELAISEGDILYVLEKSSEDDWWKAKKKAEGDDEEEPEGLIPNNYVEEANPTSQARALYEYTRQTDEELSFPEDARLAVYDATDPDWILVGLDGEYGFVPANYIEVGDAADADEDEAAPPTARRAPALPSRPSYTEDAASPPLPPREDSYAEPAASPVGPAAGTPAAALAGVLAGRATAVAAQQQPEPPAPSLPSRPRDTPTQDSFEDEPEARSPPLPSRPRSQSAYAAEEPSSIPSSMPSSIPSPGLPQRRSTHQDVIDERPAYLSPGGFHMYNINEMVSLMGKRKKMPTTLGINLTTGMILIAPERAQDGPEQDWTADKMTHYSREGKHVFIELVRPSKSFDFHAGAKDTAEEIVSALGEMAGVVRAEGLREVIMAGTGKEQKKGVILYDFMAQGEDEVTVGVDDEVIILDDTKSEEWWQVRRLKNGKQGVVPSSYIEITGSVQPALPSSITGINAGKKTIAQNRLEEERLTKEAVRAAMKDERRQSEQQRTTSGGGNSSSKRENGHRNEGSSSRSSGKPKPDPSKVRTWTDRSKSFSVEAQFLGMKDGKLNLHKTNGVKIAVPVSKMSVEDLEYVERITGISLDEDKPLSDLRKKSQNQGGQSQSRNAQPSGKVGASIEPKKSDYDWFQFFLDCEIAVGLCERYAQAFTRDSMDQSSLPDIDATVLRNLGLKEGDIIKVMRHLDLKYGRTRKKGADDEGEGGLFSGPGGTLRNNTRRGRPAPERQASDVVDASAFSNQNQKKTGDKGDPERKASPAPAVTSTVNATSSSSSAGAGAGAGEKASGGFDDDAWDVKPSKSPAPRSELTPPPPPAAAKEASPLPTAATAAPATAPAPAIPQLPTLTGAFGDLSLLTQPLQPDKPAISAPLSAGPVLGQPITAPVSSQIPPQPSGATPQFFAGLAQQQTGAVNGAARQRPLAPQYTSGQPGLTPPPPSRPLSAPQSAQPSQFTPPPLHPQMTGAVQGQVAPPGQSLNEITQQRMQQQYAQQMQMQQPMQGFLPQQTGMMPMMATGYGQQNQFMQPGMMNGAQQMQGPFANMQQQQPQQQPQQLPQQTGFGGGFNPGQQQFGGPGGPSVGVNAFLPPALEPQRTAMPQQQQQQQLPQQQQQQLQPQATGTPFTQGFGNHGMPPAPGPQPPMQPLVPQQTGPAPPVRFGVPAEKKPLMPQATGRRANLSAATPQNPFGF